jgi:hypothetical protein
MLNFLFLFVTAAEHSKVKLPPGFSFPIYSTTPYKLKPIVTNYQIQLSFAPSANRRIASCNTNRINFRVRACTIYYQHNNHSPTLL